MNYLSNLELMEITEHIIMKYSKNTLNNLKCIDIEGFILDFLKVDIQYAHFIKKDSSKLGILSNGIYSVDLLENGQATTKTFPLDTIIINSMLLDPSESARKRFTLAHEAGHIMLNKLQDFHDITDTQQIINIIESQANIIAASLLMPHHLIENELNEVTNDGLLTIYGNNVLSSDDKLAIKTISNNLGVSYKSLYIQLDKLNYFKRKDLSDFPNIFLGGEVNENVYTT